MLKWLIKTRCSFFCQHSTLLSSCERPRILRKYVMMQFDQVFHWQQCRRRKFPNQNYGLFSIELFLQREMFPKDGTIFYRSTADGRSIDEVNFEN